MRLLTTRLSLAEKTMEGRLTEHEREHVRLLFAQIDQNSDHVLSKDERKKLFDEYHMEKVVKEHRPIVHSDGGKRELRKQTRYRDGSVVSTTGERFRVEPKESAEFVKATSVSIRVTGGGRTH